MDSRDGIEIIDFESLSLGTHDRQELKMLSFRDSNKASRSTKRQVPKPSFTVIPQPVVQSPNAISKGPLTESKTRGNTSNQGKKSSIHVNTPRTKKRVVYSDSESDAEVHPRLEPPPEDDDEIEFISQTKAPSPRRRLKRRKAPSFQVDRFFDRDARDSHDEDEDDVDAPAAEADDSMGSLRDFIVDDEDEIEYESDATVPSPPPRRMHVPRLKHVERTPPTKNEIIEISSDEDVEELPGDGGSTLSFPPARNVPLKIDWPSEEDVEDPPGGDDSILTFSPARKVLLKDDWSSDEDASRNSVSSSPPKLQSPRLRPRPTPRKRVNAPVEESELGLVSNRKTKKTWDARKHIVAAELMKDLNQGVFENKLCNVPVVWSTRLLTTAGRARYKKHRSVSGASERIELSIELSVKVVDDEDRLKKTLAHEMCHIATFVISKDLKNAHGKEFKSWGAKVNRYRPDITVSTKHDYIIQKKYEWKCMNQACGQVYGRHSKSISTARHRCGKCKSKLDPLFKQPQASAFQEYLKTHLKTVKADMPGASHGDVMKEISRLWALERDRRLSESLGKDSTSVESTSPSYDLFSQRPVRGTSDSQGMDDESEAEAIGQRLSGLCM